MSKLEMNSRLLTWIRLMIGHFLEGWTYFTRKNESVMSVKVCPWWPFNMRSVTCNWLRYLVHRKSWNRRLERVWTLDFLCLRLSNFCLIPFIEPGLLVLKSWFWKLTRSRIWFKCTWDSHLTVRARWGCSEPGVKMGGWEMYWCSCTFESPYCQPVFTAVNKQ